MNRIIAPTTSAFAALFLAGMICSGASAAPLSFTTLSLKNGWVAYGQGTGLPAVAIDCDDVVPLKGGMRQPTPHGVAPFTLLAKFRPNRTIYVTVNCLAALSGRLIIQTNGIVFVEASTGANCQFFT